MLRNKKAEAKGSDIVRTLHCMAVGEESMCRNAVSAAAVAQMFHCL